MLSLFCWPWEQLCFCQWKGFFLQKKIYIEYIIIIYCIHEWRAVKWAKSWKLVLHWCWAAVKVCWQINKKKAHLKLGSVTSIQLVAISENKAPPTCSISQHRFIVWDLLFLTCCAQILWHKDVQCWVPIRLKSILVVWEQTCAQYAWLLPANLFRCITWSGWVINAKWHQHGYSLYLYRIMGCWKLE